MPKRKKPKRKQPQEVLSKMCNLTGFGEGVVGASELPGDNVMDCLDELAHAQGQGGTTSSSADAAFDTGDADESPPPPPPGIRRIPNVRIELARHLHVQTLSAFLLRSCPGLRMPAFERWLLDSKLEESDRLRSILDAWREDPSLELAHASAGTKKKYGRAATHGRTSDERDARNEQESSRRENDCKLLLAAKKRAPLRTASNGFVSILMHVDRDPLLPYRVMETDPSCDRLLKEIIATSISNSEGDSNLRPSHEKGREIVRELCGRSAKMSKDLNHLEYRLGKYQKFGWDNAKRKRGSGSRGGGNADKIHVEWQEEDPSHESSDPQCSLTYVPKKRKSLCASSENDTLATVEHSQTSDVSTGQNKPKPFMIKINALHYHKLRAMFDATYNLSEGTTLAPSLTKMQLTHAFHATLFAIVVRYSSMSGGQQLNDLRGGGMQGAVHTDLFNCLSKWLGAAGTECFASPLNSALSRFHSAFPSPDIDGHYGSHGNFFHPWSDSDFLRPGWYQLNPPFSPGVMDRMTQRVGKLLDAACRQDLDVAFVVVIPTVRLLTINTRGSSEKEEAWTERKKKHKGVHEPQKSPAASAVHHAAVNSFLGLIRSPYCKSHIVLPAREHGYIEGGQHLRLTHFKESQFSTSVIVLRRKDWRGPDAELFERDIRQAFASRHKTGAEQRRRDLLEK